MTAERWGILPCGTNPESLLNMAADQVRVPDDEHEATCAYCQAALDEFHQLWHPVREWATQDVVPPEGFLAAVISRARKIAGSPRHIAAAGAKGATTVTSWALGLIAGTAAHDTPGVTAITTTVPRVRRGGNRRRDIRYGADGVDIRYGADGVSVTLGLTASYDAQLADLADSVRHNIITAVAQWTTIEVCGVDISIDNIDTEHAD